MAWVLKVPAVSWRLLVETYHEWLDDRATSQGAALAFYALFAVTPVLFFTTTLFGLAMGTETAEQWVAAELALLLTPEVSQAIAVLVAEAGHQVPAEGNVAAGAVSLVASAFFALRGFAHLQETLNLVWGVRQIGGVGVIAQARRKLLAFASIGSCAALMLVSLGFNVVLHWIAWRASEVLTLGYWGLRLSQEISTVVLVALLLTVVYRTLPDVRIRWRDVFVGALVSAVLFVVGKQLFALWVRNVGVSGFGAASAVVAVLIYAQYAAQVLLFGAEFTFVFARWSGQPIRPGPGAIRVVRTMTHADD